MDNSIYNSVYYDGSDNSFYTDNDLEKMTSVSKYLTLEQCFKSDTALRYNIDNTSTDPDIIEALRQVGINVYDKVKGKFTKCYPSSVFRSKDLNEAIKGSLTSQHCKGEAIDIDSPSNSYNLEIFKWVIKNVDFDQLIAEFPAGDGLSWVHISFKHGLKNREEILVGTGKQTGRGADYTKFTGLESWYK